jgi:small GTP-binding protein
MENSFEDSQRFGNDLKVILLGNVSSGKTSIVERYINNIFRDKLRATISPNFAYKLIKKNNTIYRVHFWDIPGQDRSPQITSVFCRDAHGFIFCCDALVKKSREDIITWKKSLENVLDTSDIPLIILENKCDLLGKENDYNKNIEELKKFSEENNFLGAFRTSALNGYNINNAINFLVDEIINKVEKEEEENKKLNNKENGRKSLRLNEINVQKAKSNKCC